MFHSLDLLETIVHLYHQKEDFISVKYEPKDADDLKKSFDRNKTAAMYADLILEADSF